MGSLVRFAFYIALVLFVCKLTSRKIFVEASKDVDNADFSSAKDPEDVHDDGDRADSSRAIKSKSDKYKKVVSDEDVPRYLLYDVNPGEGFNLRRDVYMRMAALVNTLNKIQPWVLVLPPWGRIYHWKSRDIGRQDRVPWSRFFDLASLRKFAPVMEFEEFLKIKGNYVIDEVYYLQHYKEGWDKWEEKWDKRPCILNPYDYDEMNKVWYGWFFGYDDKVTAKTVECISVMGHASFMKDFLTKTTSARSVMLDRAETLIHDHYGDANFWKSRRSMRFAKHLRDIGDKFRKENLDSTDEKDRTEIGDDWTTMKKTSGDALGGPYLAAHLRRDDFVRVREKDVPSLKVAASEIKKLLKQLKLKKIFIATDAPKDEVKELKKYLKNYEVYRYEPAREVRQELKDGGVAIVDQYICSHARYFIGTRESTFSFRIQDEREIMGFDPKTTFNRFCTVEGEECEQPSMWRIVY